ncbi:LuxS/MPP-like metallohydrolase [Cristinia sonorae]|uniref:LuxS/MPP-like metallohydrolase n=1 Tax=Cristinia sonorae TaxID=1940300 RepID=A0A8K0UEH0_9AGAR|nr:LuxS/MPP-like metallohydrolase [Cristinia sonorae]
MTTSTEWQTVPEEGSIPVHSIFTGHLEKPDLDTRSYRILKLENGMVGVLVHDPDADKAAACVSIAVGAANDPDDVQGLAHFCEHMLSKGSVPYPAENDFLSFIISNGGQRNAGTAATYQEYWFTIKPSLLSEAFPRLAAFFHSPIFTSNLTAREIHAVDSENKRNLQNDFRRLGQLNKHLSVEGHPWGHFGTGNFASLTEAARKKVEEESGNASSEQQEKDGDGGPVGRETRRRLVEWWEKEYCAGRMSFAIVGKESLDDLTRLAAPHLAKIPNRGLDPRPVFHEPAWGSKQQGTIVFAKTVKDYHAFILMFPLPSQISNFETKPTHFLSHFIGHEGPGSICAYLKKKGWLVDISVGLHGTNREVQFLKVSGELTREGYLHHEEVVHAIFNYISLLRSSPLEPYHYEEQFNIREVSFRFKEKSQPHTYAMWLCSQLFERYAPDQVLSGSQLLRRWDEQLVRDIIELLTPEKCRVIITAKYHDASIVGEGISWEAEKWYGTEYSVRRLNQEFIDKANLPNENQYLHLPEPNQYIPEDLTVDRGDIASPLQLPSCIHNSPLSTLWFKKDDQYWAPKAHVKVDIRSPIAYTTPRHSVLTRLLTDLLEDDLAEVTYNAQLAGLDFSVNSHRGGIVVAVNGYNDKLPVLLDTVLERLKTLVVKRDRLDVMVEQLRREFKNFYIRQPSVLAEHYMSCVLTPIVWSPEDKLHELAYVTTEDIARHKAELLSRIYIEALITGNVQEEISSLSLKRAITILESVELRLESRPLITTERPRSRSLLLPSGSNFVMEKTLQDVKELNSSLLYYCQFGDIADTRLRCILRLLVHSIKEPAFSQLRTVEQLGYIVATSFWGATGSMGLGFKIQSLKSPSFVESRVDAFLKQYRDALTSMSPEALQSQKDGLIVKLMERGKNLREETSRFWSHIKSGYYDFLEHVDGTVNSDETDSAVVNDLSLHELLTAFDRLVLPSSQTRRKMSVHLLSQQLKMEQVFPNTVTVVRDEFVFKASLPCSPAAVPVTRRGVSAVAGPCRL